ncbi:MAG: hypothetical protein P1P88_06005 [Bacteroidales bacterium]|nr:hypothetical protein [Bacteroidales bacterium]
MKKGFLAGVITLMLSVILFSACSTVPQKEIDAATAAIEAAKAAGAEMYANQEFLALQDSMTAVMGAVKASNSVEKLNEVTIMAQDVALKSESKKEELKNAIQTTLADVKKLIESNTQLLTDAAKIKEAASKLEGIKSELKVVETTVNEADAMFGQGEFIATIDKAKAAKDKASEINKQLEEIVKGKAKNKKA